MAKIFRQAKFVVLPTRGARARKAGAAEAYWAARVSKLGPPDTRLLSIQIGEEAQDAIAIGGPRREGIGVQQIVAPTQTETAAFFEEKGSRGQKQCCMIPVVSSTSGQEQDRK